MKEKYDALKAEFDENRASIQAKYLQSCELLYQKVYTQFVQCIYLCIISLSFFLFDDVNCHSNSQRYEIINGREEIDPKADGVSSDYEDEACIYGTCLILIYL